MLRADLIVKQPRWFTPIRASGGEKLYQKREKVRRASGEDAG